MSNTVQSDTSDNDSHNHQLSDFILLPREVLSRTNWLYIIDALQVHDRREMKLLWKLTVLLLQYMVWVANYAVVLITLMKRNYDYGRMIIIRKTYRKVIQLIELAYSERYCYFMDYMSMAYYLAGNRDRDGEEGLRYPPSIRLEINTLSPSEYGDLTWLSTNQLYKLFQHIRFPSELCWPRWYTFMSEEAFLHFMTYLRLGETKLRLSTNYFGGDPRRCSSHSISCGSHLSFIS